MNPKIILSVRLVVKCSKGFTNSHTSLVLFSLTVLNLNNIITYEWEGIHTIHSTYQREEMR